MAAVAPAAAAVPQSNGITYTHQQLEQLVSKLTVLRDDVVAGTHPRLKLPAHVGDQGRPESEEYEEGELPSSSLPGLSNGISNAANLSSTSVPSHDSTRVYPTLQNDNYATATSSQHHQAATPTNIDPVLLEKSDTLVIAEAEQEKLRLKADVQQKRQRLEHMLKDQAHQRKNMLRHKTFDEYALPKFRVEDVLKRAQEVVKPVILRRDVPTNGGASSSDSFDENTFYSSQMNETTTSEEVAEPKPQRPAPRRLCRFFLNGKPCPYGEGCTFSHDPALKQKVDGHGPQATDTDGANAEEEGVSRSNRSPPRPVYKRAKYDAPKEDPTSKESTSKQERIAQLEAELRAIKAGKEPPQHQTSMHVSKDVSTHVQKDVQQPQEHSVHVPRGVDEFGREISLRERNGRDSSEVQQQDSGNLTPPPMNNGRVVRNHITSPYAPQPARVSPLAVSKVPQISQVRSNQGQSSHTSRLANVEVVSDGQSPSVPLQPLGNRKRRRGRESGEQHGLTGRRNASPEVRIKQEPVSPPPFQQPRARAVQEQHWPVYIDTTNPQTRPQDRVIYRTRNPERPTSVYDHEEREPLGPAPRRIVSRNGQHYIASDDPDLRRVVSERQMRAPMSPAPRYISFPKSEGRIGRAASQVYISPAGQRSAFQHRASVQPQTLYAPPGRSPSPPARQMRSSPLGPPSFTMAPPPCRVMVDQYGNQFLESELRQMSAAPMGRPPVESQYDQHGQRITEPHIRQVSVAPVGYRPQIEPQYEPGAPRGMSARRTFNAEDEDAPPQYIRRQVSPASPRFAEYTPRARTTQLVEPTSPSSGQQPFGGPRPASRIVFQEAPPVQAYRPIERQREGTYRVQSVRPIDDHYDQGPRLQSVQPQPRIVQIRERQPVSPQVVHRAGQRPDDGYARPINFTAGGGPQYQYAPHVQNGGYVQEMQEDGMHEAPRRMVQRM